MSGLKIGFALCGSYCTYAKAFEMLEYLTGEYDVTPIMSERSYTTDTRFGEAAEFVKRAEMLCGKKVIGSIAEAEPIGPKALLDVLVIAPCTGNTIAKLATGIADTPVTLAAKSHLRNGRPVLIAVSTNDALSMAATNIGKLMNNRNIFFVPMKQDDSLNKPRSVVADFSRTYDAIISSIQGKQLQPIYI